MAKLHAKVDVIGHGDAHFGDFYVDLMRGLVFVLVPVALVVAATGTALAGSADAAASPAIRWRRGLLTIAAE